MSESDSDLLNSSSNMVLVYEELAHQLESSPIDGRMAQWRELPLDDRSGVLPFLRAEPRKALFEHCSETELLEIGLQLSGSELADIFEELPEAILEQIVHQLDQERRDQYHALAAFDTDEVGRYLNEDIVSLPTNTSITRAKRIALRNRMPYLHHCYLVSRNNRYLGAVPLLDLVQAGPEKTLRELIDRDIHSLEGNTHIEDAVTALEASAQSSLPVCDERGYLLGAFNVSHAMFAQREVAESLVLSTGGIDDDEDIFSPIENVIKDRAVWLGINLLTAVLASIFISFFEASLQEIVALAVLMPIVASMGGITGSQTLSTVIRRMALEQINDDNKALILKRELTVGLVNGVLWATLGGLLALFWFGDLTVGLALAVGLLVNIGAAAWCGMTVPLVLKKFGIDPAISGAVILTTITDIVGFVSFLGSASLILWYNL